MSIEFSLTQGGPFYRLAHRLGLYRTPGTLLMLGGILALGIWLPLLALSAFEGHALGDAVTVPFLSSIALHVRFLVAIPLLFVAEGWVDPQLRSFVRQVVDSRLVPAAELPSLEAAIRTASRLRDSFPAEAILLALAAVSVVSGLRVDLADDVTSWRMAGPGAKGGLTLAGSWYAAVALPVFQFVLWRWCWRLVIWWVFLWRLSRLDLQLTSAHPDLAGGLGYLGIAQGYFGMLAFAASSVLAGIFAENMMFAGGSLAALRLPVLGILVINLVVFLWPLLLFSPRLLDAKRRGLREYGILAAGYTHAFEAKWVRAGAPPDEPILGTADIQSLADLANSFEIIRRMRIVPFGLGLLATIVGCALAPLLPLLLLVFPLDELIVKALQLLLGM